MIFPLKNGSLILDGSLISCRCDCGSNEISELAIRYDWQGTDMADLDTKTVFLTEKVGWSCADPTLALTYLAWLKGGNGLQDDRNRNGYERVNVRVDRARENGQWTSSVNIELYAGWHLPAAGSGPATVSVTYRGVTQSKTIHPGTQNGCAATHVGTIIVYSYGIYDLL